jgi:beta-glucosidase
MPWIDDVAAVVEAWYPGQEAGNAIADVLTGRTEPGGRLPQSFPVRWADNPTHSQDREVYPGLDERVRYEEGVFIGYRHYDKVGVAPLFPFGFGLSYTQFELSEFVVDTSGFEAEGRVAVRIKVTNAGARAGSTVVQLYVGEASPSVPRPQKELKAFEKGRLAAGEGATVTLNLEPRDFAFFDLEAGNWRVNPGTFHLMVGTSSADIAYQAEIVRKEGLAIQP